MDVQHLAAFAMDGQGGNPAGVVLLDVMPDAAEMARVAADVGHSETAFAVPLEDGAWRVRYFSPESEVPFCGHATIALGAALGQRGGDGTYDLVLNDAAISVTATRTGAEISVTLTSPPTHSRVARDQERDAVLGLMGLGPDDLDPRLPAARIHAGADHLMLALHDRARLAEMAYDLDAGRKVMRRLGLVTVMLVHAAPDGAFDVRNAFASGGVLEDPATGAAAAAFAGYLRAIDWPHGGQFIIRQGADMGVPSLIHVQLDDTPGAPVRVSGAVRAMADGQPTPS